jgi:group I intron endonuclease
MFDKLVLDQKKVNMAGCIYIIKSTKSKKFYVGSARYPEARKCLHFQMLSENRHHSPHLQHAYNKHGKRSFSFKTVEIVDDLLFLRAREQFWISRHKGQLYNISPSAFSPIGIKHTKKTRAAVSKSLIGNTRRRGKKMPKSAKEAISKSLIGNSYRKGIPHSDKIKKKISEGLKKAYAQGRHAKPDRKMSIKNLGDKCKKRIFL